MNKYLNGLSAHSPFPVAKPAVEGVEAALPGPLRDSARRARELVTGVPGGGTLFEELGFNYIGPIDGMTCSNFYGRTLRAAKARATGPVLIHAVTVKGKGYAPAENLADKYITVWASSTLCQARQAKANHCTSLHDCLWTPSLTDEATAMARSSRLRRKRPSGTGLDIMATRFPDRVFDVGIAEQHGVTFGAGMAAFGAQGFRGNLLDLPATRL